MVWFMRSLKEVSSRGVNWSICKLCRISKASMGVICIEFAWDVQQVPGHVKQWIVLPSRSSISLIKANLLSCEDGSPFVS